MSPRRAAALRGSGAGQNLREHLIATAARLIADGGTAELTVRRIARAAGVADGVLYNYFADKEELLANAMRAYVQGVESGLGSLPEPGSGTVAAGLRAYVRYGLALHQTIVPVFAGLRLQPQVLARFTGLAVPGEDWRDRLLSYLCAEQDLGRLPADAKVATATAMIVGVCHEMVLPVLLEDGTSAAPPALPQTAEDLVAVVLSGIGGHSQPAGHSQPT